MMTLHTSKIGAGDVRHCSLKRRVRTGFANAAGAIAELQRVRRQVIPLRLPSIYCAEVPGSSAEVWRTPIAFTARHSSGDSACRVAAACPSISAASESPVARGLECRQGCRQDGEFQHRITAVRERAR